MRGGLQLRRLVQLQSGVGHKLFRQMEMVMPYVAGSVLAMNDALFMRFAGFDRVRAFYSTILIVVAAYYVLFAVMGDSIPAILAESAVMLLFVGAAVVGFKRSLWFVAVGLAAHCVLDSVHRSLLSKPGVPGWWPAFVEAPT